MDRFFSLLQTTTSCCKWSKIWLGSSFVGCPPGHRSWSLVVLAVHKWHLIRYRVWNKTFCWWLCLIKKINASYTLERTDFKNAESIKYLGVTITSDLWWNTHVSNVCTKANRTLGFLRTNLYSCPQEVKEAAYKGLVRPVLDYGSSVWDPPRVVLQEELESVQKRAARFVTGNNKYETGSMTGIPRQLKWESL